MRTHLKPLALVLTLGLMLLAVACATKTAGSGTSQDALTESANALWQAKTQKDWSTVYDLTTASYKQSVSREVFLGSKLVEVKSYAIKNVTVDQATGTAQVEVAATIVQGGYEFPAVIKDKWMLEGGRWGYVPAAAPMQ